MNDEQLREEVLLTQQLVRIESTNPGVYEGAVSDFVFDWLKKNTPAEVIREPVHEGRDNIIAVLRGASQAHNLVYICHMDTMPVGEGWHYPPLDAVISNGKLYGRGSCDMKAGLAAAMTAFRSIAQRGIQPKYDFLLIATVNEEDAMTGAEQVVRDGFVNAASYILDAEPTDSRIQVAHKGKVWFMLHTHGQTCHASTPEKGCDAIAAMAEIITRIRNKLALLPKHAEMGPCTATFGVIEGGWNPYIVPDACTASLDLRIVPPVTDTQVIALVDEAAAEAVQAVPGVTWDYEITARRPAVEKDNGSFLLRKLRDATSKAAGREFPVDFFPGYTDTAVIASLTGCRNCMSFGPGSLEQAHRPDEFVPCCEITRSAAVMTRLAEDILL
ncbi:MAG: M20 family metallopeptidase [Oscillospiraceae bacterium]|nr:M20 family metallopeptidase [Oscillospiraceae bacterium]